VRSTLDEVDALHPGDELVGRLAGARHRARHVRDRGARVLLEHEQRGVLGNRQLVLRKRVLDGGPHGQPRLADQEAQADLVLGAHLDPS
jgi:hypothetical protein